MNRIGERMEEVLIDLAEALAGRSAEKRTSGSRCR
jgi:hypothetical protein